MTKYNIKQVEVARETGKKFNSKKDRKWSFTLLLNRNPSFFTLTMAARED